MNRSLLLSLATAAIGLAGCSTNKPDTTDPKITKLPEGMNVTAVFDVKEEFLVHMMPRSDGRAFHPVFMQINADRANFSTSNVEELIRHHLQVKPKDSRGILVKSNHHLVAWDAQDRKSAQGTELQERHFSPEWKTYRDEERVLLGRLIRAASNQRVKVWINQEMGWIEGKWRLMTPPFDLEVRGDAESFRKKKAEINSYLDRHFSDAKKAGKLLGIHPDSRWKADVRLPGGWESLNRYPLVVDLMVQVEGSDDLLEYRYVQAAHGASWQLQSAWRVHEEGKRTRLALPKP